MHDNHAWKAELDTNEHERTSCAIRLTRADELGDHHSAWVVPSRSTQKDGGPEWTNVRLIREALRTLACLGDAPLVPFSKLNDLTSTNPVVLGYTLYPEGVIRSVVVACDSGVDFELQPRQPWSVEVLEGLVGELRRSAIVV